MVTKAKMPLTKMKKLGRWGNELGGVGEYGEFYVLSLLGIGMTVGLPGRNMWKTPGNRGQDTNHPHPQRL